MIRSLVVVMEGCFIFCTCVQIGRYNESTCDHVLILHQLFFWAEEEMNIEFGIRNLTVCVFPEAILADDMKSLDYRNQINHSLMFIFSVFSVRH